VFGIQLVRHVSSSRNRRRLATSNPCFTEISHGLHERTWRAAGVLPSGTSCGYGAPVFEDIKMNPLEPQIKPPFLDPLEWLRCDDGGGAGDSCAAGAGFYQEILPDRIHLESPAVVRGYHLELKPMRCLPTGDSLDDNATVGNTTPFRANTAHAIRQFARYGPGKAEAKASRDLHRRVGEQRPDRFRCRMDDHGGLDFHFSGNIGYATCRLGAGCLACLGRTRFKWEWKGIWPRESARSTKLRDFESCPFWGSRAA
jgi:hypothetical protein